ncbi:hypothetical protein E1218_25700 [Kribbella turkmenica]|uniref:Lipoprotein n=1 Tax=Kribbella turkmenica TaxID=2530375 RepID=A0A4R4WPZ7_9ACTN|nr:hypothetical protein [Kribbella turkmenica]TDD18585.1 hypothetical protein E1218_25700 [Kribbella turkmenica]
MFSRILAAGLAVAGLLGTAGCKAQADARQPEGGGFELFLRHELTRVEQAGHALFHRCITQAGYSPGSSTPPRDLFGWLAEKPVKPRTVDEARRNGFGTAIPAQPAQLRRTGQAYYAAVERCETAARAKLGDPAEVAQVRDRYTEIGNRLGHELGVRVKAVLQEESDGLVSCLGAKGYPLPTGVRYDAGKNVTQFGIRLGANTAPVVSPARTLTGGAEVLPAIPARPYRPSPQESAFAIAFAECGTSTGLFDRLDARLPSLQQQTITPYRAELTELNLRLKTMAAQAAGIAADG